MMDDAEGTNVTSDKNRESQKGSRTMIADIVLKSNVIYTGIGTEVISGGVAVKDNKIIAVGADEIIAPYIGETTVVKEYEDKLIMPGFIDDHLHVVMGSMIHSNDIQLEGTKSAEECVEKVRAFLDANPDAGLVMAMGWMISAWDKREWPTKEMLDAVSTEIPICLSTADGWFVWVNSKALELFGYTKESVDDAMAEYVKKDENGELTGMLYSLGGNPANYMVLDIVQEKAEEMLTDSFAIYSRYGITAVGDLSNEREIDREPEAFALYRSMEEKGKLDVRVYVYPAIGSNTDFSYAHQLQEKYRDGYVVMPGLKAYEDGVIDGYTGVLVEPYEHDKENPDFNAEPIYPQAKLDELVTAANKEGFPVRIHCTGDGGVRMALNSFEASEKANGKHGLRNSVEHIEMLHEDDYPRFQKLDVIAGKQPAHLLLCTEDFMLDAIGEERWKKSHPLGSMVDAGAKVTISTDFPIVEVNPFYTLYAALTRCMPDGQLVGADTADAIDIYQALHAYTYMGAYALDAEDQIGSLEAGKLADIAVIDGRVIDESPEAILGREALLTMMDGRIVYEV